MTINDVLFFDTETTGLIPKGAEWETNYNDFPHVVQLAWIHGCKVESHIILPEGWEIPQESTEIHGITMERALREGEPFAAVIDMFIQDCHEAGLLCGHNIHFDTQIIKANILRELGQTYFDAEDVNGALYKGKRIDTMRPSMKWVDARTQDGRLKFPRLEELYSRCFPGETFPAHDALEDTKAVAKCLPVILDLGLVELKVKEYPEEQAKHAFEELSNAAKNAADAATKFANAHGIVQKTPENGPILNDKTKTDKLPIQQEKGPQNENSDKISGIQSDLLEQNDF